MFDWLFERKVRGYVFFTTPAENPNGEMFEHQQEMLEIIMSSESPIEGLIFRATRMVSMRYLKDALTIVRLSDLVPEDLEDDCQWGAEVNCWEGAWNKIKNLPWVEGSNEEEVS